MEKMGILVHRLSIKVFFVVLFVYWCLLALLDPDNAIAKYSHIYWLYVSPVFILLLVFFANALFNFKKYLSEFFFAKNNWSKLFVLWFFITTIIAIYNRDWSALRIIIPWTLIISSLVVIRLPFKLYYLNAFFLLSLFSSVIGYHLGLSQFGYLLGQSKWNCFSLSRVSLYPSLFDSAFISLVVLIFNFFYNKSKVRLPILLISTYFIIFSANRTVYLCFGIFLVFLLIKNFPKEKFLVMFGGITSIAFALLVAVLIYPDILAKNQIVGQVPFIDKYVFHKSEHETCSVDIANIEYSNISYGFWGKNNSRQAPYYHIYGRGELLRKMFSVFKKSPLLGIGHAYINADGRLPDSAGGSESFLAGLLVRFGISSSLFILSFLFLAYSLFEKRAYAEFIIAISAIVSWSFFGSSASIYNFNFLLTLSLILSSESRSGLATKTA